MAKDGSKRAIDIAEQVVMTQGSIFIRELLRKKKKDGADITIGVTKEEILANLVDAIKSGAISEADLDEWVGEVEGWGRQHAYVFKVGARIISAAALKSPKSLQAKIQSLKLASAWGKRTSLGFPAKLELAKIDFDGDLLEVGWQQGYDLWKRDKSHDPPKQIILGDTYEFRAYRQEFMRSVMRFVMSVKSRKAALFLQLPLDDRHDDARKLAETTLAKFIPWNDLTSINVSQAIKAIDDIDLKTSADGKGNGGRIRAQNTRFSASGATVEFDADVAIGAWKKVPAVRQVRQALKTKDFTGDSGKFSVSLKSGTGMNRDVVVSLQEPDKRIYLHSQMTATEVWLVIDEVVKHG